MSSSSKSKSKFKSKDKNTGKETPNASSDSSNHANTGAGISTSGYHPLSRTFYTTDLAAGSSGAPLRANGHFRNIDETDDHSGSLYGESEDRKETTSLLPPRHDRVPSSDNDMQEKTRQKNEKKHRRQKERRAQELHEKCCGYLMSRKLEAHAQQLVAMGFPLEQATMALILDEGRVEESVAWLLGEGEEAHKDQKHNLDGGAGGDLKIDISDELAYIVDLEIRYQCSMLEVERALVACEGDLVKAEETLIRSQKQKPLMPPKPEETSDPPTVGSSSTDLKLKRDEKASNYSKVTAVANPSIDHGNRAAQTLHRSKKKLDSAKPPPVVAVSTDKRLPGAVSNPSSNSAQYEAVGNQLKNLRLGSLREHVVPMRQPQSINEKQIPTPSASSSSCPPETSAGWFPDSIGAMNPNPNSVGKSELYSQLHYQQQQFVSNSGLLESLGTNWGNNLWNMSI